MDIDQKKCVIIIDSSLPKGVAANVASILSISIGHKVQGIVGHDIVDKDGITHQGLTRLPIPILGATPEEIISIREKFLNLDAEDKYIFDFSTLAQQARTYEEYQESIAIAGGKEIIYLGIALIAGKNAINKTTKGLSLI
ncbi:DUF2000 domain-containing protein [Pedobacter sp. N23S346]|uniref:DUF2000 domain-containing protein n=1 Tax=Pedobacter sp. N23S346 TaxID=3402750 RepID=UPI003AD30FF5